MVECALFIIATNSARYSRRHAWPVVGQGRPFAVNFACSAGLALSCCLWYWTMKYDGAYFCASPYYISATYSTVHGLFAVVWQRVLPVLCAHMLRLLMQLIQLHLKWLLLTLNRGRKTMASSTSVPLWCHSRRTLWSSFSSSGCCIGKVSSPEDKHTQK